MRIVLRYDDYGPSPIPEYYDIEKALFELFFELEIPMIVGAVPLMPDDAFDPKNDQYYDLQDEVRIDMMKQALTRGFQLALHGYTHQVAAPPVLSEFAGQSQAVQADKIRNGLRALHSCFPETDVDIFIPPWNSYDAVTAAVISQEGFHQLSAGDNAPLVQTEGVVVSPSYPIGSLLDFLKYYSLDELARLVGDGTLIITFHAYQFFEPHDQFALTVDAFGDLLRTIRAEGYPIVPLAADASPTGMKPAKARLLAARFGLFAKSHTRVGKAILKCSQFFYQYLGQSAGRLMMDGFAQTLYMFLRVYRR